jgi:uncharacterized protein YjiS (DUF1127 family)
MRTLHGCRPAKPGARAAESDYVALHQVRYAPRPELELEMSLSVFKDRLSSWRRYRQSVRELNRLSDRELADLGIGRAEIPVVVRRSMFAA